MRKVVVVVVVLCGLATACAPKTSGDGKVDVVANFYPIAFAAQQIGGSRVHVTNLTPAGVEPHDVELTSKDVDRIGSARLVLYLGGTFQPAVAAAAKHAPHKLDVSKGLLTTRNDPHFWLDPMLMRKAVSYVTLALVNADPAHRSMYDGNGLALEEQLAQLDADYRAGLAHCTRTEIVTTHAAFGYLARRYGLTQLSIAGVSPEAEADPQHLAQLTDLVERDGITTVFSEELVPPALADTLAREAHIHTAVLSPLEGLTKSEQRAGDTYFTVMRRNLAALRAALGC